MIELSVVIPTFSRVGLLLWCLEEYKNQSLSRDKFEIVVVNDGGEEIPQKEYPYNIRFISQENKGPAAARNLGVKNAIGKWILFCGDDCLPHRHLLYYHWLRRHCARQPCVIQGYTDWHPAIPPDDFHRFLHGETKLGGGGLQANWGALKSAGKWISPDQEIPGWFLTTNVSIDKDAFEFHGGFSETFRTQNWEDIEFSIRWMTFGGKTFFEPKALNWHYHCQTLDRFVQRQISEGRNRLPLVVLHPHMGPQMLDVEALRSSNADMLLQHIALARELHDNQDPAVQEVRQQRWQFALRLASLEGIRQGLKERGVYSPVWRAVEHLHVNDAIVQTVGCAAAWEREDWEYATVCCEWANKAEPDCWAMPAVLGEILLKQGKRVEAMAAFRQSMAKSAGEKWPLERVGELSGGMSLGGCEQREIGFRADAGAVFEEAQ